MKTKKWIKRVDGVRQRYVIGSTPQINVQKTEYNPMAFGTLDLFESEIYVPPNWKNVEYHTDKNYLATGIDKKGRTQYVYNKKFIDKKNKEKHYRVNKLKNIMPETLKKVTNDVGKGNEEAKAVYTIYKTGFRPGSDRDTKSDKKAYGVTTLKKEQVKLGPNNKVIFDFNGKKGVQIKKEVKDKTLHNIIKQSSGKKIFKTNDDKVRNYFNEKTDGQFSIKDLRTLKAHEVTKTELNKGSGKKEVGKAVSLALNNTPAVALKSYVDPEIIK